MKGIKVNEEDTLLREMFMSKKSIILSAAGIQFIPTLFLAWQGFLVGDGASSWQAFILVYHFCFCFIWGAVYYRLTTEDESQGKVGNFIVGWLLAAFINSVFLLGIVLYITIVSELPV